MYIFIYVCIFMYSIYNSSIRVHVYMLYTCMLYMCMRSGAAARVLDGVPERGAGGGDTRWEITSAKAWVCVERWKVVDAGGASFLCG